MLLRYQRGVLIGFTLLIYSLQGYTNVQAVDEIISEQEGKTVIVPCPVNKDKCGDLHSLNWFKGDNRIAAMLLDDSNVTSVAEEFEDRVTVEQNPFRLIIRNLQISDEDIYLCDTTYFIPIETCDNFNGHRVELNVLVPPSEVVILDEKGDRMENGSVIGPMQERHTLKATCIVKNTRPQPQVGWWRGNKRLTTHSPSYDEKDGLFTATLELSLQLSRDDLGHSIECRAESAAIEAPIKYHFKVDLQVRPISITINGVEHHTVQGSKVVLTCDVHGARPAVNLTWFNTTQPIGPEENDLTEIRTREHQKEDGTFHTQSELIFNATRFENDISFKCQAENIVLLINREAPMQSSMTLEVMYPPVVKVSPPEITVNTSDTVLLNCEYVANPASLDHVVWYRNGEIVNVNDTERYEGGNSENVALVIRSTDKLDIGNYTCQLTNPIGKGISEQQIDLDVQFVPIVEVLMIPEGPVKESDESNVTLFCNILDANPSVLTKVRWYANATLLKELPDCEETREDLCHIDPSKLLLESIGRGFFYNYSCEGYNAAGWGPRSDDKELLVHYEPGPATLTHFPLVAIKKKSIVFSCSIEDPGYPESNRFRWMRGGRGPLQDIVTKDWTVEPVGLDSRTNYSCYAFNEGGKGVMATINLEVHAPPFFIKNLPPYTGMLHTSRNANLTCRIECVPRCEISWLKDGVPIEKNDTRYFVKDKYMDASPATGDFESMLSVLHFNMSNWPNNKFDIEGDNANYTCVSTGNTVGPGIKSATYFSIEYAPDNTTISEEVVYVQEETIPGRVICKSRANPDPTYEWRFNNKTVIRGNALIINTPMMRNDTGHYTCVAFNKHGRSTAETFIDVQYKPRCEMERKEIDDKDTLICTAFGNPEEADFSWSIKAENETAEWLGKGDSEPFKDKSYYVLKEDYAIARTYRCVANNTAGAGTFCEIEVAEQLAWWQRWDKTKLIILVASILVLLLAVIIICCVIICICRRRRRQDKYRTDVSMSATHSVLSYQPNMPQVIAATTVLPDTLKVPIIPSIIMPATITGHLKEKSANIIPTPPMITTPKCTPKQTPILAKPTLTHTAIEIVSNTNVNNNFEIQQITNTTTQPPSTTLTSSAISTITTTIAQTLCTSTQVTTTTPILSVRCTQIPKSPPRWPLRPGVMVHVSSDTKENLAVNRMTLKPNATLANLTGSTVNDSSVSSSTLNNSSANTTQTTLLNVTRQSSTLGRNGRPSRIAQDDSAMAKVAGANEHKQLQACKTLPLRGTQASGNNNDRITEIPLDQTTNTDTEMENMVISNTPSNETTQLTTNNEADIVVAVEVAQIQGVQQLQAVEPLKLKKSNYEKVEAFFSQLFFKRSTKSNSCRDSQRSHVGLLGGKFWKRSENTAASMSAKSPFTTEHRLKGIRSSGIVTYKKCAKTTTSSGSNTCSTQTTVTSSININNTNNDLCQTLALTTTQQQIPSAQTQQQQISAALPTTQQQQLQHQLQVSTILMQPSLDINHPPAGEIEERLITRHTATCTKVIQSTPSTIMSSREITRNPSMSSIRKGILKAPTPPPRPPQPTQRTVSSRPQLVKRSVSLVGSQRIETVQTVQEKSSSMADPLTEPGEYENLPFHGLQTAPNKFTTPTTPTNFNNNTNVVRSVPRPKRLNGNISQTAALATQQQPTTYYDEHDATETQQQQQQYYQQQQQQYSTMPYNRHNAQHQSTTTTSASTLSGTHTSNRTEGGVIVHSNTLTGNAMIQQQNNMMNQNTTTGSNPHQVTYNLNNCFPKSYTEYYQNQQQQLQHPQQHSQQQFQTKFNSSIGSGVSSSNAHMINAIEPDFSTYAVVERPPNSNANAATTNPFLAVSNFKKFDASGEEDARAGSYQTTSMKRQGKRKTFVDKLEDKRFYSLKFSNNSNKHKQNSKTSNAGQALHLNHSFNGGSGNGNGYYSSGGGVGVLGSLLSANNKCKRHHSFAGGSLGDIDPKGPVDGNASLNFYDPPAYENVNDAIQVHSSNLSDMELGDHLSSSSAAPTATVLLHSLPYGAHNGIAGGSQGPKKKHHQRQHQPKEDLNLIEPERLSIYRSDSGISNSSYECVTPLPSSNRGTPPPMKTPRTPKTPKTPKAHKSQTLAHSAVTANFNSAHKKPAPRVPNPPLYMNLNEQQPLQTSMSNLERPNSPNSTVVTSAYESASSSQNDNTCNDPISLSSSTSLYSSSNHKLITTTSQQRCNRHQQVSEITTPEEFEQYQLGHHAHSTSSLSVASSVSATGSNVVGVGIAGRTKCKKQQRSAGLGSKAILNHLELTNKRPLATNPFLAANPAATTTTTCHKKLHRRQTISDPYAHIKHIDECRRQSNNIVTISDSNNYKTHNYCTKSTNTFKATVATSNTQSSAYSPFKSQQQQQQQQQQIVIQPNSNKTHKQQQQPSLSSSSSCQQFTAHHQQQMLMFYEQQNRKVDNNCKNVTDVNGRPLNEDHVVHGDDDDDEYVEDNQSLNMPHMSVRCDVAANDDEEENVNNVAITRRQQHHHQPQQQRETEEGRLPMIITKPTTTVALENAATTRGYVVRPVKLPLRKYHSFHFQPTQTVAGQHLCKLQQLKLKHEQQQHQYQQEQQQQQQHQPSALSLDLQPQPYIDSKDLGISYEQPYAKQGPLLFRPYTINENVTFKPIQASEESEDSIDVVEEYVGTVKKFLREEEHYMDSGDFSNLTQRLQEQQDFLKSNNSPYLRNSPKVCRALFDNEKMPAKARIPGEFTESSRATKESVLSSNDNERELAYTDLNRNYGIVPDQQVRLQSSNSPQVSSLKKPEDRLLIEDANRNFSSPIDFVKSSTASELSTVNITQKDGKSVTIYKALQKNSRSLTNPETFKKFPNFQKVSTVNKTDLDLHNLRLSEDLNRTQENLTMHKKDFDMNPKSFPQKVFQTLQNSTEHKLCETEEKCTINPQISITQVDRVKSPNSVGKSKLSTRQDFSNNNTRNLIPQHEFNISKPDSLKSPNHPKVSSLFRKENPLDTVVFNDDLKIIADNVNTISSVNAPTKAEHHVAKNTWPFQPGLIKNPENVVISANKPNLQKGSTKSHTSVVDLGSGSVASGKDLEKVFRPYSQEMTVKLTDITKSPLKSIKPAKPFLRSRESKESLVKSPQDSSIALPAVNTLQFYHQSPKKSQNASKDTFKNIEETHKVSTALNPAASLEALEQLTKSNPQLWYTSQPGSRQNLHQLELFHTIQNQAKDAGRKLHENEQGDEEDLGYSFCEDEFDNEDDDDDKLELTVPNQSPNVTVILAPNNQAASRVKYILTQNHGEPLDSLNFDDELIYADLESQHYGPIDYKAASIYAQVKRNKQGALKEVKK